MINASRMKRKQLTAPRVNIIKLRGRAREEERKSIPVAVSRSAKPRARLSTLTFVHFAEKLRGGTLISAISGAFPFRVPRGPAGLCSTKARHLRRREDKSRKVVRARARARLISEISVYRASFMTQSPPKRAGYIGVMPSGVPN
jgi:hypothetical protein